MDVSVEKIDEKTRKIYLKPKQKSEEETMFEQLLKDINSVLQYLSYVEYAQAREQGVECRLQ